MNIEEFSQYLKDPGSPELKALFEEAEAELQQYDAKLNEINKLSQQIQELAFSIDLECAEWKYEMYTDDSCDDLNLED